MPEPGDKYKDIDFIIGRIGMPAVILAAFCWFFVHEFSVFRREVKWDHQRMIRNQRSMMQKLGIPIILDGDNPKSKE